MAASSSSSSSAINYKEVLAAAMAAPVTPWKGPTGGCGRIYLVPSLEHKKGMKKAAEDLGLTWLKGAHGSGKGVIYLGYDNAHGNILAKGRAVADFLRGKGVHCYSDEVGD